MLQILSKFSGYSAMEQQIIPSIVVFIADDQ